MAGGYEDPPERRKIMALKQIMLRHQIEQKKTELENLRAKAADFDTRAADLV